MREKFSKYLGYIRGIDFEADKSIHVTVAFPLEYKKILMLTLAE